VNTLRVAIMVLASACGVDTALPGDRLADAADAADDTGPTYYRDVAAISTRQCAGCHQPGGAAPFPLTTYAEMFERATKIAEVTAKRIMPPWPADASGACGTFVDQRWLSASEIETIGAWVAAGARSGDPADAPVVEVPPAPAFTASVELASDVAYGVAPGPDEYRCIVVDPGLATDSYITAMAVRLDQAAVVHHVQLFAAASPAGKADIAARDAADPGPGYRCGNEGVGTELRYVGVWAAGDLVRRWPAGSGIWLSAGSHMVVQFHYHSHDSELVADRSRVALELAPSVSYPGIIDSIAGAPLYLPPGQVNVDISAAREVAVSQPSWLRAARIHMHKLGTRGRMELIRGDQTFCLLDIPRWDFGWQLFYTFDQAVAIEPGDQIRVTCSYNTQTQIDPVVWGLSTDDEMCLGYSYVTP